LFKQHFGNTEKKNSNYTLVNKKPSERSTKICEHHLLTQGDFATVYFDIGADIQKGLCLQRLKEKKKFVFPLFICDDKNPNSPLTSKSSMDYMALLVFWNIPHELQSRGLVISYLRT
jgi:hypothetical protein